MAFKLIHSNKNGSFKLEIHRNLSGDEIVAISQLACNLIPPDEAPEEEAPVYGPHPPQNYVSQDENQKGQNRLGEFPVDNIKLGDYTEPNDGVRLKLVSMINRPERMQAIRILREITNIPIVSCKEIAYGNIKCPIMNLGMAQIVLEKWRALNVFAKIVQAHETMG